jgi:flagellar basal-body rod protein FlgB
MAEPIDIVGLLETGIKAEGLRQQTIASNIANLETPGYRRLDINFEDALSKALKSSDGFDPEDVEMEIIQPGDTLVKSNGNVVNLEVELGAMVKNSLRHTTYVRLLNKKFAQMGMAIRD